MKILQIWKNDYPWDVRVEKISRTLLEDDYDVHLICSNIRKKRTREDLKGLKIHRLPNVRNDFLNRICSLPLFFNPLWLYNILNVIRNEKINIILARDLPLAPISILAGKIYKIPVIFDMTENYPAMWREMVRNGEVKSLNRILKNPKVAEIMENYILRKADHIIVVVEESKERVLRKGISENKVSIVSNTPDLKVLGKNGRDVAGFPTNTIRMLYVGAVDTAGRGLDTVIRSIPILVNEINDLSLTIVGDGVYLNKLKKMVKNLSIDRYVNFTGWVEYELIHTYIQDSDICIVPHYVTEHVNTTIPNKLFEYMTYGKPVLVTDAAPMKRIVEENNCGRVFRSGDVRSFAEEVMELKDPNVRLQIGKNGYSAVSAKYNWDEDSRNLREIFNKIGIGD